MITVISQPGATTLVANNFKPGIGDISGDVENVIAITGGTGDISGDLESYQFRDGTYPSGGVGEL